MVNFFDILLVIFVSLWVCVGVLNVLLLFGILLFNLFVYYLYIVCMYGVIYRDF